MTKTFALWSNFICSDRIVALVYLENFSTFRDSEQTASELVMALEEASQSLDLRGSWEYTENCSEMNFAIVAPSLPASGNYTCYNMWCKLNHFSLKIFHF